MERSMGTHDDTPFEPQATIVYVVVEKYGPRPEQVEVAVDLGTTDLLAGSMYLHHASEQLTRQVAAWLDPDDDDDDDEGGDDDPDDDPDPDPDPCMEAEIPLASARDYGPARPADHPVTFTGVY